VQAGPHQADQARQAAPSSSTTRATRALQRHHGRASPRRGRRAGLSVVPTAETPASAGSAVAVARSHVDGGQSERRVNIIRTEELLPPAPPPWPACPFCLAMLDLGRKVAGAEERLASKDVSERSPKVWSENPARAGCRTSSGSSPRLATDPVLPGGAKIALAAARRLISCRRSISSRTSCRSSAISTTPLLAAVVLAACSTGVDRAVVLRYWRAPRSRSTKLARVARLLAIWGPRRNQGAHLRRPLSTSSSGPGAPRVCGGSGAPRLCWGAPRAVWGVAERRA